MNKTKFALLAASLSLAMAFTFGCAGNKAQTSTSGPQLSPEEQEIQKLQNQAKLDSVKRALELQRLQQERDFEEQKAELAKTRKTEDVQMRSIPCASAANDAGKDYWGGLGVSTPKPQHQLAIDEANMNSVNDISQRFVGVIKNASERYGKGGITKDGKPIDQSALERISRTVSEKVVNKFAQRTCMEIGTNQQGMYIAYQTLIIPIKDAVEATVSEMDVMKLDYDRKKFRDSMNEEIANQKKDAENIRNSQ